MMMSSLLLLFLVTLQVFCNAATVNPYFSVFKDKDSFKVVNVNDPAGVVTAKYENNITTSGWAHLSLKSNSSYTDHDQMYAAGYLEGAVTAELIYPFWQNLFAGEYNTTVLPDVVVNWLNKNTEYMFQQIKAYPDDPYWIHISLVLAQLQGVMDGYNANSEKSKQLTYIQFLMINTAGDMGDLLPALGVDIGVDWSNAIDVIRHYIYNSHCSVLVKVADDLSDLYVGHTTWNGFYCMMRIFKTYDLPVSVAHSSNVSTFSSYPASLASIDDYYLLDTGLVVTETTNGLMNGNNSLYAKVVPSSVLCFIRTVVANRIASSGQEWVDTFSKENSGTYNNQWIVVDTNKLVVGSHLENGTLFILEQVPGYIESADVTDILSYGYWPSFNIPYFQHIYEVSGFAPYAAQFGPFFSYENNPRAEIFRRDSDKVSSIEGIQQMMRYNDYKIDPLSQGTPAFAISSRFDLVTGNSSNAFLSAGAFGGYDSKVTSATLAKTMTSYIQSGPTHDDLPPFTFKSSEWESVPHVGLPDLWNFSWVAVTYSGMQ